MLIQSQPGNAAFFCCAHQRGGGGPQRTTLRIADEVVARGIPVPVRRHAVFRPQLDRQQRRQQFQRQFAGGDAFLLLRVFVDHGVNAGPILADAAGLAEGDVFAGHVLQLDGDVFQHMSQPGAFDLAHAANEAARFAIRTTVLGQAGQGGDQPIDERRPEFAGGPGFQRL